MWWIESGDPWNPNIDQFTALHGGEFHEHPLVLDPVPQTSTNYCFLQRNITDTRRLQHMGMIPSGRSASCNLVIAT